MSIRFSLEDILPSAVPLAIGADLLRVVGLVLPIIFRLGGGPKGGDR